MISKIPFAIILFFIVLFAGSTACNDKTSGVAEIGTVLAFTSSTTSESPNLSPAIPDGCSLNESEPNDTFGSADGMANNSCTSGYIGELTWDTYYFLPAKGETFTISTDDGYGGCQLDTQLYLSDYTGKEVAYDNDGGPGLCSKITYTFPIDGFHYVEVYGLYTYTFGDYRIIITN